MKNVMSFKVSPQVTPVTFNVGEIAPLGAILCVKGAIL